MIHTQERLRELASSHPQLLAFQSKVAHLAEELRFDELEQFLQQYLIPRP